MLCVMHREVKVMQSNMFYIGTSDEDGLPHCRVSEEYYKTRTDAQAALDNRSFTERRCFETVFCCGGASCFCKSDRQVCDDPAPNKGACT